MKKSILTSILLFVCLSSFAYDFECNGLYYSVYDIQDLSVSVDNGGYKCYTGTIDIPNTVTFNGKEFNVVEIKESAFSNCDGVTKVNLGKNLKYIGVRAFYGTSISSVTIPANVIKIGSLAFSSCDKLTKVVFEDGEKPIIFVGGDGDGYVFSPNGCFPSAEEIYFGRSWPPTAKNGNYSGSAKIVKFTIGPYMTDIPNNFLSNSKITEIIIPPTIKTINGTAFTGCNNLTKLVFQDGDSPLIVVQNFKDLPIKSLYIGRDIEYRSSYDKDIFHHCRFSELTIGASVTKLIDLWYCNELTKVVIPSNVKQIGGFRGCDNLMDITCYCQTPPSLTNTNESFSNKTFLFGKLTVPEGCSEVYKNTEQWKDFFNISEISAPEPEIETCKKPVITYHNKKLSFNSETNGAICHSSITCADAKSVYGNEFELDAVYNISVYATADGYKDSEVVSAKLYWIDATLEQSNVHSVQANTRGILVQHSSGFLTISGLENNEIVYFYDISGKLLGETQSIFGEASFCFGSTTGLIIVQIGSESIKVAL